MTALFQWAADLISSLPKGWVVLLAALLKSIVIVLFVILNVMFMVWLERKVSARIQRRIGPNRVGRFGMWQLIADTVKLLGKEDIIPSMVDRWLFVLAPLVVFATSFLIWVVMPLGPNWETPANLNVGVLYLAAVTSFTILGVFMSGWGSNNKYSVVSSMRAAAVMMSYEIPQVLAVMAVAMVAGSLSLTDIVGAQSKVWYILLQPLAFIIFFISSFAELNRTPFDLAEAESELIAGYNVEYSGLRFAFFFLAEYANLLAMSALMATLFLGGWRPLFPLPGPIWFWGPVWFVAKTYFFVLLNMWVKWTLPRIRIDQLMEFCWKFLLPLSLLNIALTGLVVLARV